VSRSELARRLDIDEDPTSRLASEEKEVLLEGGHHDPREDEKLVCEPIRFTEGSAIGSNVVADSCTVERDGIPDHRSIG
jgi:hypothetical protein